MRITVIATGFDNPPSSLGQGESETKGAPDAAFSNINYRFSSDGAGEKPEGKTPEDDSSYYDDVLTLLNNHR